MTQEAFIEKLDDKGYSYEIEGDKIVVTYRRDVDLESLTSLPPGVEFKNGGDVDLRSLTSLPPGVVFKNGGYVYLRSLTSLPPDVEFNNGGDVWVRDIIGGFFNKWKGNLEQVDDVCVICVRL